MRRLMLAGSLLIALSMMLVLISCNTTTPAATPTPTPVATPTPTTPPTSSPITTPTPAQANANISGFAFVPSTLTVSAGTTVTWTNNDSVTHTITSNDNLFNSGNLATGATFSHTFNQKGTFTYHCSLHTFMTAKVIVE